MPEPFCRRASAKLLPVIEPARGLRVRCQEAVSLGTAPGFTQRGPHIGGPHIPLERSMAGRIALPILVAALLTLAGMMPQARAQALGPDEAYGVSARPVPRIALSAAQKRAIY